MDNKTIFAQNLKRYMDENRKSRQEVCDALGFNYYTFSDWINARKYPRMDKVEILAEYFGIKISDLIEDKKEKPVEDDGLSESQKALIEFAKSVPEDKAAMILRVIQSIVEAD